MKNRWVKWGIPGSLAEAGLIRLDDLYFDKYFFQICTYTIGNTSSSRRLKLLLLTDLHLRKKLWPFHKRLARKINHLSPDLILISGDVVDMTGHSEPVRRFFSLIHSIPKVAILGNH